ncbi:MAG: phosphoenolpyruvate--protein phosphotransferase [Firmicutes bacterium HGW-Firmicutes-3]|jgi:phosphotransferase system enzyme I (PtsI)|nr:MAG: phosphoenolpyruvate--protein phosphotransferase [Firmicutes bacterium HGW-Firmicutes-3]
MEQYTGKSICQGIAIGRIKTYVKEERQVKRNKVEDVESEVARYRLATQKAIKELRSLRELAVKEVGEANADIFEVHAMMLEDSDYMDSIENIITTQEMNAEYAVAITGDNFYIMFSTMEDEYFKARAIDMKDISERVIAILSNKTTISDIGNEAIILVAEDLTPSETVQMDKDKLLAFSTFKGSSNSHTAILARTMNIPAIVGIPMNKKWDGQMAIVDGFTGTLTINPNKDMLNHLKVKQQEGIKNRELLLEMKGKEDITLDGKKVKVYANIGGLSDLPIVQKNDAKGIGLFRSEFLYLENDHLPTEEEQLKVYKSVLEIMAGKKVIVRTMDIGADKQVDYLNLEKEDNPALGYRAIRICLDQTDIFKTQLRALFRASIYGNLSIMYPMIISLEEVHKIKQVVNEVKRELTEQGFPFGEVEQGIMIETPAAVMMSAELAEEVDFFSIGTNDLTQYTLAIDRQNSKLEPFYDSHHPAIFRMIKMVVDNAHHNNCWVGVCGELGADLSVTDIFLQMGVDELSVSPNSILPIRKKIRDFSTKKTKLEI